MRALLMLALAGALSAPQDAFADNADEEIARAHFQTGLSYYDSNRFEPAVKEFLEAYRLSRRPALLYNIGRTYEKLDDPGRATVYYRRYLDAEPSAIERTEIATKLVNFAPRVGELAVKSEPAGAEIAIDGETIGYAPIERQSLTAGTHEVSARGERFAATVKVTVEAGVLQTATVDVKRGTVDVERPRPETPRTSRRWLWPVLGGVGAAVLAAVVVGLVFGLSGTDYSALGRGTCLGSGCVVVEPK